MAKGNWRDGLADRLFAILDLQGVKAFLQVAVELLSVNGKGAGNVKSQMVGEVCEIVIVGLTQRYLNLTGKEGKIFHSMILKDLNSPKSNFRTELDFTLATPGFILTTECKSYSGDVNITGRCTLGNGNHSVDVYSQSKTHHKHLVLYGQEFVKSGARIANIPVFANAFVFSNASIDDRRSEADKRLLRVLTTSSLFSYYDAVFKKFSVPVFDTVKMFQTFKQCEESVELHKQHKSFVGY